jgi:predicted TIM-barrel fold metal-dependent hydrolase
MVSDNPARFGFLAALPMPATEAAVKEAAYALDTLKADGVVLLASAGGKFLGDSDFDELMAELNSRKAVVFVHPNIHPTSERLELNIPGFYLEFLFDTTRAVANLIFTGAVERYPDIRWILAHAGGTVPYVAWRLSLANLDPSTIEKAPRGVLAYLRSFYYETALSPSPYAMPALLNLVDASQVLFGSDYPYAPSPLVAKEISDLQELKMVDEVTQKAIARENALALFPRFKQKMESVPAVPGSSVQAQKKIPLRARIAISLMRKVMGA